MIQRDVPPEHQLAVIRLQKIAHAIQVLEIDRADALGLRLSFALALAQLKGFVFANMEELAGKEFVQFPVPVFDNFVRALLLRRQYISQGRLSQLGIFFQPQSLVKMTERLLLGNQFDVIVARVSYELFDFRRRERTTLRPNQRM